MADYPISKEAVIRELINLRDRLGGPFAKEVLDMALTRLEGFPQMDGDNRWISVEERLPEHGAMVLCNTNNYIEVLQWHEKDGLWFGLRTINSKGYVTHWMPLPEPPKEE